MSKILWLLPLSMLLATGLVYVMLVKECEDCGYTRDTAIQTPLQHNEFHDATIREPIPVALQPRRNLAQSRIVLPQSDSNENVTAVGKETIPATDTKNMLVPMPSGNTYTPDYHAQLTHAISAGTLTFDQRRDYFAILNNRVVAAEERRTLHKTMMLALRQGKVSMQQFFGANGTF